MSRPLPPIDWADMLDQLPEDRIRRRGTSSNHVTMEPEAESAPRQDEEDTVNVATEVLQGGGTTATAGVMVKPMTRRSGGVGAYGLYMEGRQDDGTILRGFLAAEVFGQSTLAAGAKGARWDLTTCNDAEAARANARSFFGAVETSAVLVELTGQDVSRLRRSVLSSAVYPLQDILSATADDMWAEEEVAP
jgi:hypothetical protein